jgi:hypothetical protein
VKRECVIVAEFGRRARFVVEAMEHGPRMLLVPLQDLVGIPVQVSVLTFDT